MAIKAVLFDMDGVLIDAKDWHYQALNDALELFGVSIDRDAHLATFDGLPTRRKLDILNRSRNFPMGLQNFINDLKQAHTQELIISRCRPVFNHRLALSRLSKEGYKLAVCSNSIRQTVSLMMELSSLATFLNLQLSNEDVKEAKPAPDIYLMAMEKLGVTPQETLILEDNDHGIAAALASGAHLMRIGTVDDVNYERISTAIRQAELA